MVGIFAVKIRPAGHGKPESGGDRSIPGFRLRVVVAVTRFQRRQPVGRKALDVIVHADEAGVRERCDAARATNRRDGLCQRRALARHVRGATLAEQSIERVGSIAGVAVRDQRIGNLRTADGLAGLPRELGDERGHVKLVAEVPQALADCRRARATLDPLPAEKRVEDAGSRLDEIAKDVDISPALDRRNLDAVDDAEAERTSGELRLMKARRRVVIGDAEDGQTGGVGTRHERRGRQPSVGRRRVQMKINH